MRTTKICALLVAMMVFGGKAFGQEQEQVLPKSMIKIGVGAFLTQEVKSSDMEAAVNSYPFIGGGLEVSYYHRLPYHFGVNVGFGAQFQPSVFDNTGDSEVKDIYTIYTPMICLPFSIEKASMKTGFVFLTGISSTISCWTILFPCHALLKSAWRGRLAEATCFASISYTITRLGK